VACGLVLLIKRFDIILPQKRGKFQTARIMAIALMLEMLSPFAKEGKIYLQAWAIAFVLLEGDFHDL